MYMEAKSFFGKAYVQLLMTLVLLGTIIALGAYAYLTFKQAEGTYTGATTISIQGEGEVLARPDIGQFSFSVQSEAESASKAQELSAQATNNILEYLKEQGVEDKDIKTQNYSLNPKYRYEERVCPAFNSYCPPGERVIDGYEVSQSVVVKVRDLEQSGDLITGAGEKGATNISSLQFTIDDETVLQAEARKMAIADAQQKAVALAKDLDARIVRLVGFYENEGGYPMYDRAYGGEESYMLDAVGTKAVSPSLPVGEESIKSNVTLTYEIR